MSPIEFFPQDDEGSKDTKPQYIVPSWPNFLRENGYKLGSTIGEGSYCKVKFAVKWFTNGQAIRVACKVINKRKASSDFIEKFLPREITIMKHIHHPNILQVFDVFQDSHYAFIFTNYCEKGDLLEYVKRRGALAEYKAREFFSMLVSAVQYLHALDISHRDVKCENIFITANDNLILGDFGFARLCRDPLTKKRILSDTFCGSAAYAAPEILQGIPYNPKMYDVWSLGCVLYIMLTGSMPFDDTIIQDMLQRQLRRLFQIRRFNLDPPITKLLFHMLEPDVTRRATINQISQSPWLRLPFHPALYPVAPVNYEASH